MQPDRGRSQTAVPDADETLAKHCVGLDAKPTGRVRVQDGKRQREWLGRFGLCWIDMACVTCGEAPVPAAAS